MPLLLLLLLQTASHAALNSRNSRRISSEPVLVAPCFYARGDAYAPLKARQQFRFVSAKNGTGSAVSPVASPTKCLSMPGNGTLGPITLELCLPGTSPRQNWAHNSGGNGSGLVDLRGRQACAQQNPTLPFRNTPMWLQAWPGGACLQYDADHQVFRSTWTSAGEPDPGLTHGAPAPPCDEPPPPLQNPMCNLNSSIAARIGDLISRLEETEKPLLLVFNATAVDRLWIGPQRWWNEALHGLLHGGAINESLIPTHGNLSRNSATEFPSAISTAASFNTSLFFEIGSTIGNEARASHNATGDKGATPIFWG